MTVPARACSSVPSLRRLVLRARFAGSHTKSNNVAPLIRFQPTELYLTSGVGGNSCDQGTWGGSMSKTHVVAQHLPYLRRYARALTGSQASGDAYVAATLEALVKEPQLLGAEDLPRVALFRLFSAIWNSLSVNGISDPVGIEYPAERRLGRITAKPRQAFLLVSVEGFSEEHAARILDVDTPTLRGLVEESGRELAAQIATDVLIIEDEALIALDLQALVENLGHKVIGVARTKAEALAIGRPTRPGLILAD